MESFETQYKLPETGARDVVDLNRGPSEPWQPSTEMERFVYQASYDAGRIVGKMVVHLDLKTRELSEALEENRKISERADRDDPTGLYNREYLMGQFDKLQATGLHRRKTDNDSSHSIMMVDADHFKKINDIYGHVVGDETLKRLASVLQDNVQRDYDVVARVGGEEFCILLPYTTAEEASDIADRLRLGVIEDDGLHQLLSTAASNAPGNSPASLSVSIGLTQLRLTDSFLENWHRADLAMFKAKRDGRNLVRIA